MRAAHVSADREEVRVLQATPPRPRRISAGQWANRSARLVCGLMLFGVAIGLLARARVGVPPWDVLAQGIAHAFGFSYGFATMSVSAVVLLLWIPLRQRLGVGTLVNVLLTGPFVDLTMLVIPDDLPLPVRILMFILGVLALGIGTGVYLSAALSPGPRDGLMTGLHQLTGWNIGLVRTGIEITVLLIGTLLGGNLGWGTLAFAVLIGPVCGVTIPYFARSWKNVAASPGSVPTEEERNAHERITR